MLEAIRPDLIVVTPGGQARITDLSDLLPLPLPPDAPLRGTLYTAPELMAGAGKATPRAGLYGFGGLLYSLHIGRELSDSDFDRPGTPKPFIPRFPDVHPGWGRLLTKTFRREADSRFPTDEAVKEDASGFVELARTLRALGRTMDVSRLEIASWTTTGIVRTGNEDAFALIHSTESRQDDLGDQALILLCDGMGGYEAGEVAAALTIQELRKYLLEQPMFAALAGKSHFPNRPAGERAALRGTRRGAARRGGVQGHPQGGPEARQPRRLPDLASARLEAARHGLHRRGRLRRRPPRRRRPRRRQPDVPPRGAREQAGAADARPDLREPHGGARPHRAGGGGEPPAQERIAAGDRRPAGRRAGHLRGAAASRGPRAGLLRRRHQPRQGQEPQGDAQGRGRLRRGRRPPAGETSPSSRGRPTTPRWS